MQMTMNRTGMKNGEDSEITIRHMGDTLADLIDLTLQGKQAHWNVVGPRFRSLHLQLDQLVAHTREYSDSVAERIVTLGEPAHGSPRGVDQRSKIDPFPEAFIRDEDVVKLMVERLDTVTSGVRERIAAVRDRDPVSEDLLVQILGTLEEHMWMLHAQAQ